MISILMYEYMFARTSTFHGATGRVSTVVKITEKLHFFFVCFDGVFLSYIYNEAKAG